MVVVLRGPRWLGEAHPQVGDVGEVKIHVEGVGSPGEIIREELIHHRRTVSVRLLLAVRRRWKVNGLRGKIPVHLTLYLRVVALSSALVRVGDLAVQAEQRRVLQGEPSRQRRLLQRVEGLLLHAAAHRECCGHEAPTQRRK